MKIAINKCHGGFRFSKEGYEWLISKKGWTVTTYAPGGELIDPDAQIARGDDYILYHFLGNLEDHLRLRTNPDIIEAVEVLGPEVNHFLSHIEVVTIPEDVDWEISENDGVEHIAEKHRTWGRL